jgi:DNA-binding NtrC family response regulator
MKSFPLSNLIGSSTQFQQVRKQIQKIASVDVAAFISGETGSGKELAVRAIHYLSARSDQPFVPVNCGALPETLIESELFGHERGAFTDAKQGAIGLIAEADGGSLFLDEIDSLSLKAQAVLLRFLQDGTYRRVGGTVTRQAHVRVIAASNACMEQLVEARQFRQDLLYRLNILTLRIPSLRERESDALELAHVFLQRLCKIYKMPDKCFHLDALAYIKRHSWPGNVRELENTIHREFLMSDDHWVRLGQVADREQPVASAGPGMAFRTAKSQAIAEFERDYLLGLLARTEGNISSAARIAGQDRSAFARLVRKHGLAKDRSTG